jgi:hypothetical protein
MGNQISGVCFVVTGFLFSLLLGIDGVSMGEV